MRPLIVRQIAGITQLVTIVFRAVFGRPHRRPSSNQATSLESQMIHPIQLLPGPTLRATGVAEDLGFAIPSLEAWLARPHP